MFKLIAIVFLITGQAMQLNYPTSFPNKEECAAKIETATQELIVQLKEQMHVEGPFKMMVYCHPEGEEI